MLGTLLLCVNLSQSLDSSFHNTHSGILLIGFISTQTNKTLFIPNLSHLLAWITCPIAITFLSVFVMSWVILEKLLGDTHGMCCQQTAEQLVYPTGKGLQSYQQRLFCQYFPHKHYLSQLETLTSRNGTVLRPTLNPSNSVSSTRTPEHEHLGTPAQGHSLSRLLGQQLHTDFVFAPAPGTLHTNKGRASILFFIIYPFLMVVRNDQHKCCLCLKTLVQRRWSPPITPPFFFLFTDPSTGRSESGGALALSPFPSSTN